MATDIVRRGKIILDLETGKTEINAPALDAITKAKERQLELDRQMADQSARLNASQSTPNARATGSAWNLGLEQLKNEKWQQGLRVLEQQRQAQEELAQAARRASEADEQAQAKAAASRMLALKGMAQVGQGFLQITRAAILLGVSSDDALGSLIRNLAYVQAGFDLLKGSIAIASGLSKMFAAGAVSAAALTAALTPLTVVLGVIAAVVIAAAVAWRMYTDSERQAKEEALETARAIEEANVRLLDVTARRQQRERESRDFARPFGTNDEQRAALDPAAELARAERARRRANLIADEQLYGGGAATARAVELERDAAIDARDAIKERIELEKRITEEKTKQLDDSIEAIKTQERLVEAARQQLEIDEKKLRSTQAQFGAMNALEQQQIKGIRDKLLAGQDITKFEEDQFAKLGGRASDVIETRRAKRGATAGLGDDFFNGLEGAGKGVKEAADELKKVVDALNKLTDGLTAGEAVAKLEADKAALAKQYKEFYAEAVKTLMSAAAAVDAINKRLTQVEEAARRGTQ